MRILGIETSCDETAAAVVDDGRLVRSNVVASQIPIHERFGGVVPEIASRQHVLVIDSVVELALAHACYDLSAIDAVAVTYGPGLSGPLLVGTTFAKGLALGYGLPLLAVNHIEGHVLSVWLSMDTNPAPVPELPMVALVASGGHTELVLVTAPGTNRILGQTVDDAAGEAFDKVGRLLGLPYPGGPSVEAVAETIGDRDGVPDLPRAWLPGTLNFSFSGLKTAMVRAVHAREHEDSGPLKSPVVARMASSFQESVADVLTRKLVDAVTGSGAVSASIV
ncbi:MAG TPA: tRNA (adenosine(37)-N6)-threonylcarbamoyltransferase complex transferase subunit TsaD, partial [Chloroflexota bacterium]|nr:tRNA (adenosine(37)-N6)-threonylcarbamoyltransferase complex transferase subunit TsaD [Chloroflexota bacterium]